ncbi:MAG: endonuclease/exonuclease/phosphatase family protein [Sediminicola sp.]
MRQERIYKVRTIAFYNVENLFDTINDPLTFDDDRTPLGKDVWTSARYREKIRKMAKVISSIGADVTHTSPDILGLCEIENRKVVEDLISDPNLRDKGYGIVHYDSPDRRGIDVALLYKESAFIPTSSKSHRLLIHDDDMERKYTRDQLVVSGYMDGEPIHFLVNHWPSRSGGEARSRPHRMAAAELNKRIIDSLRRREVDAKIIGMGDFNDDPSSPSLKKILGTKDKKKAVEKGGLYNAMAVFYRKGEGTLAYRDQWNVFDQLYLSEALLGPLGERYRFWKANIFRPAYLTTQSGPYKGYPYRTYAGGSHTGGYSDHYPVYLHLIRSHTD